MNHVVDIVPLSFQSTHCPLVVLPSLTCCQIAHNQELSPPRGQSHKGSTMQRDMKCDVTCCTVTSASLLAILCLASGRSENTRFTDTSMEHHQLLTQRRARRY